ncbi:hypothetical protein FQN54_008160 [Arachnomyces sp. PD_36]|nr:hypothetical protein FQN54_008160 [Arachnomyces sp. PD_36]
MATEIDNKKERWLSLFEENIRYEKGTVQHDVASIIKDMLLSNQSNNTVRATAYQLNTYYWERNNENGPFFTWAKTGESVPGYISFIIDMIVGPTPFIPYDDPKQDLLVQLILELRNLPRNPVKAWDGDHLLPPEETEFGELLHETWASRWADSNREYPDPAKWKQRCDEWVNFSAFLARCVQARIDDDAFDIGKYPRMNIDDAVSSHITDEVKRNSWVMVAAQYVLLAGPVMDEEFIQKPEVRDLGMSMWQFWAEGFKKVAEGELASNVKEAVIEARKKMIAMRPELFFVSEGGSKPDAEE